ncbi:hypothetical protein BDW75DRAFT_74140 [Aspergillus navahoensis]
MRRAAGVGGRLRGQTCVAISAWLTEPMDVYGRGGITHTEERNSLSEFAFQMIYGVFVHSVVLWVCTSKLPRC